MLPSSKADLINGVLKAARGLNSSEKRVEIALLMRAVCRWIDGGAPYAPAPRPLKPLSTSRTLLHEVQIECPGEWSRADAAVHAIEYTRAYMQETLPGSFRLTTACPMLHVFMNADGTVQRRWLVTCVCKRTSDQDDLPWAHLLDKDWGSLRVTAHANQQAIQGDSDV